jgi:hypothetical protein
MDYGGFGILTIVIYSIKEWRKLEHIFFACLYYLLSTMDGSGKLI